MPFQRSPTRTAPATVGARIARPQAAADDRASSRGAITLARVASAHAFLHSNVLRARARAVIPGGSSDRSRGDLFYPLHSPGFIRSGKGCRVIDADGRSYIEYGAGTCPVTLGYGHPEVTADVEAAVRAGAAFSRTSELEPKAAEVLAARFPAVEMVRFFSSERDAVAAAVAIAKAATGRPGVVRVTSGMRAFEHTETETRRDDKLPAAIVLDAADGDEPPPSFFDDAIGHARARGCLVILDERTSGFRWSAGGAQVAYGITPDLSVFGSGATNGFAFAALAGARDLMRLLPELEERTEYGAFPVTPPAADPHCLATLLAVDRVHAREAVTMTLHERGRRLVDGARGLIRSHGLMEIVEVRGRPCRPVLDIHSPQQRSPDLATLFMLETIRRGVLMPTLAPSLAHDGAAIDATLEAIDGALGVLERVIDEGVSARVS